MQHHCRLLPAVSTSISMLAHGSHLHVFQSYVSAACGHAAVAEGAATGECHCEGVSWPGEMEASPR